MKMTKEEVLDELVMFLSHRGGAHDWDDFISIKQNDPRLDQIRSICAELQGVFPAEKPGRYCGERGFAVIRLLSEELKAEIDNERGGTR